MTEQTFAIDTIKRLISIDVDYYRKNHKDLSRFSDDQLYEHYAMYGYREGRVANKNALRENFFRLPKGAKCLEIGPFFNPVVTGKNVKYVDVLSTSELTARAKSVSASPKQIANIPNIDFVSKDGSLEIVNEKFDYLVSSHNLEHQPDLVGHLNQASAILNDGGRYKMAVPNCAYCFDADLPPSKISDIIHAHRLQAKTHSIAKVIEHRALTTHNDSQAHWETSFQPWKEYTPINSARITAAIEEFDSADGKYIDVHSWQFLPHTLADILRALIELNLIHFRDLICYGPVMSRNEFCIELIK